MIGVARLSHHIVAGALLSLIFALPAAAAQDSQMDRRKAAEANAQLAIAYMSQGDMTTARDKIEKALEQDPHKATTQLAAGFVYDRLGEDKKAKEHFEEALKLSRDDPDVQNSYAAFLCVKGDSKQGEELLLQAATNPLNRAPAVAYANAGRCARSAGRLPEAEKYFRQALSYNANQPDVLVQMAQVEFEIGDNLQARAFLERYASSGPVSAASLWLGYRIERALGATKQAALYADRIRKDFPMSTEMSALREAESSQK
jgi:type IV pilus assembly protein PilF